jgi:2-hydroxy-3-keto-5-methylthiopentenyl-1-phosphate phosphatase
VEDHIAAHAVMDPAFPGFAARCSALGWHVEIVSDGLSIYIDAMLARHGLDLPRFCNEALFGEAGVTLAFPNSSADCGKCGSCKLSRVRAARERGASFVFYAGDGISDECPAPHVDLVFAKGSLAAFCRREGIDFVPFGSFRDIQECVETMLRDES